MSTECPSAIELYDYACMRLHEPHHAAVQVHVRSCRTCQALMVNSHALDTAVRSAVVNAVPAEIVERLTSAAVRQRRCADGAGHH
jgi:hypothetical protein